MPNNSSLEGIEVSNEVTEEAVLEYVGSIANGKSIYDNIPVKVYKYLIPSIITPLTHIINKSLSSGVMPESCKRALVTPIYIKGKVINWILEITAQSQYFLS